jgi:ribosome recycling factor
VNIIHGSTVNVGLIDSIRVEYHGQRVPISHIASTSPSRDFININVYDPSVVNVIVKQLQLDGLSAYASKTTVRVTIPIASEETRDRNKKRVRQLAEEGKVAMRQVRAEFRKKKQPSQDEQALWEKTVQKELEGWCLIVDKHTEAKLAYL